MQQPSYAASPVVGMCQISTANTNLDGTGTIGTVVSVPAYANSQFSSVNGAQITAIVIQAAGVTTAGMVRLFLFDGTNTRLWRERPVTALTPGATVQAFSDVFVPPEGPLSLPPGWSLKASTHNAEIFNIFAESAAY